MASRFTTATEKPTGASRFTTSKVQQQSGGFTQAKKIDPSTTEGLTIIAKREGLEKEAENIVNPKPRLSILQRLGAGLSAFETGQAVYTGSKQGALAGVKQYAKDVYGGVRSAITGEDVGQTEKKTYKDIAEELGVQNKVAKFGIGLVGDILLDPTTYFGGAIAKGAKSAVKGTTNTALKTIGKVAPETEVGIRLAGQGVKNAFGKAFIFGHGTSKGLKESLLETTGKISKAKEGIVRSNIERLGTGTLSKSQQDELVEKLLSGKRAEYAVGRGTKEGVEAAAGLARSSDKIVQEAIEKQTVRSQKFAKAAGIDDPYTVYFPGIAKDKLKKFFDGTKNLRVGSEGYRKEFKNILKDDELVKNPAEAFARREFEVAKDSIVRSDLRDMVKNFGKPLGTFKSADEAAKAGYQVVKEKGRFGKEIGYLANVDKKFIDNLISPEFATIDAVARATGFDALTSLFKRSVTGLFAPFHVRNYASGMIQNYEVLGPKVLSQNNIVTGQKIAYAIARGKNLGDDVVKIGNKSYSLKKIIEPFTRRFETSSQYISDIGDATAKETFSPTTLQKINPLSAENIMFRKARAIGNFIETQQKAVAYVTALRDGKSVKDALDLATRAGFDYRALTPFESKVLRRIIPFYSFTRKNIELQLKTLGESPERIANVLDIMDNAKGDLTPEEITKLPDYAREQVVIKMGESGKGIPEIAAGFGTPVEAFATLFGSDRPDKNRGAVADTIRKVAGTINPVFKIALERAFNQDFYRDRPLNEVVEATEYAKSPEFIKNFLKATPVEKKNKDGTKRTVYNADPYRLQLLRSLPTTRGAVYLNAIYDEKTTGLSRTLNALTGVKPKPIDLETVEYFRDRDRRRELEDLLIRSGALKRFERAYIPSKN